MTVYLNRTDAGQQLAQEVAARLGERPDNAIVLALPRGGVPVGVEVAKRIGAEFDVLITRKLGMPFDPEFAFGAIGPGGACYLNPDVLERHAISDEQINQVRESETAELSRREHLYRGNREFPTLNGKTVIVVDDGIATGASIKAALLALKSLKPGRVVLAVPVAPKESVPEFTQLVDEFICPLTPEHLGSVGEHYAEFGQVTDAEVLNLSNRG